MPDDNPPDDLDLGQTIQIPRFGIGQKIFRRYTLQKILGRGGMGVVWLARDEQLQNLVALKVLPEALTYDDAALDALKRETKLGLNLAHPNIVRIYDFQQDEGGAAISMEYVDGPTLSDLRITKPNKVFSEVELLRYLEPLCDALHYAHTREKIVHRDLKPRNLMLNSEDELKVTDFGISKSISESVTMLTGKVGSSGSPPYISPQQWDGERTTALDDIYSVGATLYELLSSKPPLLGVVDWQKVHHKVPPPISQRRLDLGITDVEPVSAHWEEVIATCLAKDPKDRPQTIRELQARLTANPLPAKISPEPSATAPQGNDTTPTEIDLDFGGDTIVGHTAFLGPKTDPPPIPAGEVNLAETKPDLELPPNKSPATADVSKDTSRTSTRLQSPAASETKSFAKTPVTPGSDLTESAGPKVEPPPVPAVDAGLSETKSDLEHPPNKSPDTADIAKDSSQTSTRLQSPAASETTSFAKTPVASGVDLTRPVGPLVEPSPISAAEVDLGENKPELEHSPNNSPDTTDVAKDTSQTSTRLQSHAASETKSLAKTPVASGADLTGPADSVAAEPPPEIAESIRDAVPSSGEEPLVHPDISVIPPKKIPVWVWLAAAAILLLGSLFFIFKESFVQPVSPVAKGPALGDLIIESEPVGAAVSLDQGPPMTAPNTFKDVKFGTHRLTVTLEGYLPIEQELRFDGTGVPKIVLQPKPKPPEEIGKLSIRSDPPGALIRLDGTLPQSPPDTFTNVKFGEHHLTAALEGFESKEESLPVSGEMNTDIVLKLTPVTPTSPQDPLQALADERKQYEADRDWPKYRGVSLQLVRQLTAEGEPASKERREMLGSVIEGLRTKGPVLSADEFRAYEKNLKYAAKLDLVPAILVVADNLRLRDSSEAFDWYSYAADVKQVPYAMTKIAWLYWRGECGRHADKGEGFKWFKLAQAAGDTDAGVIVGKCYLRGRRHHQRRKRCLNSIALG